ncbi:MAG: hypothetical protein U0996_17700 [Planctomycetaceae bacterium]
MQTGIVSLHDTTNAIRFLFDTVGSSETRKLLLLQNASFLPQFRESMKSRGQVGDTKIDELRRRIERFRDRRFHLQQCCRSRAALNDIVVRAISEDAGA